MYYPIEKFIEYVQKNPPSHKYYLSGFHQGYLNALSLDDYTKYLSFLFEKDKRRREEYRRTHIQENKERKHRWYMANRERILRKLQEDYIYNRAEILSRRKKWRKDNPEKARIIRHKSYIKHYRKWLETTTVEERRVYFKKMANEWREKNREKYRKYVREFMRKKYAQMTDEQKQKRAEYYKAWQQKNRDKICQYMRKYNAKKRAEAVKNTESHRQNQAVVEVQAV